MSIDYLTNPLLTEDEYIDLLRRSTLGERRPVDDRECIKGMLLHADILCTAWDEKKLIGVARSVTDFHYCCYLSDLAVDVAYQKQGIGRELIRHTRALLGPRTTLILLSAPAAREYYPRIGFDAHPSAWVIRADEPLM